jgi:uncharacterized protein YjbJ (UPF0337 family)
MGTRDKASNKAQDIKGKGKEKVGRLVGNQKLEREGKRDQSKSAVKNAGEHVKQAVTDVKGAVTLKK